MYVVDFDDLCDSFDPWEELHALKERFPGFRCTLFAIPSRCSDDLLARYRALDWVELGVHGYHHSSRECAVWGYEEAVSKLDELADLGWPKLFKAPGWQINEHVYKALRNGGWALADHANNSEIWGDEMPQMYVYNMPGTNAIHGHTWDVCDNGPSDWDRLFADVPEDAEFGWITATDCPPPTYLWAVLDDMNLEPGDLFVDVGAFTGVELDVLHGMGVHVLSYEPNPKYAEPLKEKWAGVEGVEFKDCAVGDKAGTQRLFFSSVYESGTTLVEEKLATVDSGIDVEVLRLADELKDRKVKVLKLDCEGLEWEILWDLWRTKVLHGIEYVYVEDHLNRIPDRAKHEMRERVLNKCREDGIALREWV